MRPAAHMGCFSGFCQSVISRISIRLDISGIIPQKGDGHIAGPGWMILIDQCRFFRWPSTEHPHIGFSCIGTARFIQNLNRRLIHIDQRTGTDFFFQQIDQYPYPACGTDSPVGHGRPRQIDPQPGKHLFLAIERKGICKL